MGTVIFYVKNEEGEIIYSQEEIIKQIDKDKFNTNPHYHNAMMCLMEGQNPLRIIHTLLECIESQNNALVGLVEKSGNKNK